MDFNSDLLRRMVSVVSPPGRESTFCKMLQSEINSTRYAVREDTLGNLIVHKKGNGKRIMLTAHMDQIGLIVTRISKEGFLSFFNLGGLILPSLIGQRVVSTNGIEGVINTSATKIGELGLYDLYIDIGRGSREEAEKEINIGDTFAFRTDYYEDDAIVIASGMDDKIGCFVLMELIKDEIDSPYDLSFVFTVQEEVGTRGARTSGYGLEPDVAISVDITPAGDSPGIKLSNTAIGKGVAIKVMDPSMIAPEHIVNQMKRSAEEAGIRYQLEILERGGSDSGAIHLLKTGIPSGVLSIPTRNAHTPNEIVSKSDVINAIRLLKYMLTNQLLG